MKFSNLPKKYQDLDTSLFENENSTIAGYRSAKDWNGKKRYYMIVVKKEIQLKQELVSLENYCPKCKSVYPDLESWSEWLEERGCLWCGYLEKT